MGMGQESKSRSKRWRRGIGGCRFFDPEMGARHAVSSDGEGGGDYDYE